MIEEMANTKKAKGAGKAGEEAAQEAEFIDQLNRVYEENRQVKGFRYFCDTAYEWYVRLREGNRSPEVVILGTGVPDELVRAFGIVPYRLLGGSRDACAWSDGMVPRDTDPVSRSVLGYLHWPEGESFSESLFIVPLYSDSMRKIAYLLKREGRKVFTIDYPPVWEEASSRRSWRAQMSGMMDAVAEHLHRGVGRRQILEASRTASRARQAMGSFLEAVAACPGVLGASARILVQNSYYMAEDPEEWGERVREMTEEVLLLYRSRIAGRAARRAARTEEWKKPEVLLLGSPVYFPNLKICTLLSDVGLFMRWNVDASTAPWFMGGERFAGSTVEEIADAWHSMDGSGEYVVNGPLREQVRRIAEFGGIDGVVFHVLKGQIEQDFELSFFEEMFESMGIPVIRLETDYQYQDLEQLRIRLEAFREMLGQGRNMAHAEDQGGGNTEDRRGERQRKVS